MDSAVNEARLYQECGLDGILVENMHDVPYLRGGVVGPEVTSCMTRVCSEVKLAIGENMPLGVQILAGISYNPCHYIILLFIFVGANAEAVAVAQASGADFIRAEGFVYSHVADEGWMDSCAGQLLRYRKAIGADNVLIFTDIKKKHRY